MSNKLVSRYNLPIHADPGKIKQPVPHQVTALNKLDDWLLNAEMPKGGILTLPTGAGKTFTAMQFLCGSLLSDGYKMLWIAGTHHLLEQAFNELPKSLSLIEDKRKSLQSRVISSQVTHFKMNGISENDDIIFTTSITAHKALKKTDSPFGKFLESAGSKLVLVIDEAHHSPATSYKDLVQDLRNECSDLIVLGLTATPTYTNRKKRGWLNILFPQGIIHQESYNDLIYAGVLARPRFQEYKTNSEQSIDETLFESWRNTNQDLPEDVIRNLAQNNERNQLIIDTYLEKKEDFGKTLIFVDRIAQAELIAHVLQEKGVRAEAVFSQKEASTHERDGSRKRDNADILSDFRNDRLDVLINIRMLTEGTDVPNVDTVFITRQTTSQILLTQMVGRALRGPQFGGTEHANIVMFIDEWQQNINWASFEAIFEGDTSDEIQVYKPAPPMAHISIDLIRRLAGQIATGENIISRPFITYLPIGWYRVKYDSAVMGTDDTEVINRPIIVFENEKQAFTNFIDHLEEIDLAPYADEELDQSTLAPAARKWKDAFFEESLDRFGTTLEEELIAIVRHFAQYSTHPRFYAYEDRELHNLDDVAGFMLSEEMNRTKEDDFLRSEYSREDRSWNVLYHSYESFKTQMDSCINRKLHARRHGLAEENHIVLSQEQMTVELTDDIRLQALARDNYTCSCCGHNHRRSVKVFPIMTGVPMGHRMLDSVQLLCRKCSEAIGENIISFRSTKTPLSQPASSPPRVSLPLRSQVQDPEQWKQFLSRTFNLFYRSKAVNNITIGKKGEAYYHWNIQLNVGHDPQWLSPHLELLLQRIQEQKEKAGKELPLSITVSAPEKEDAIFTSIE